jgi:hypothetical protein
MPPSHVTRFYGNTEYALGVIRDRQIPFVRILRLNDPFDPYFYFETDFGEDYNRFMAHVRTRHPENVGKFAARLPSGGWDAAIGQLRLRLETVRNQLFVLSTSAARPALHPKDNLYMWGHYGNGHRGIAIEFDTAALERAVRPYHEELNGTPPAGDGVWAQIKYDSQFGTLTAEDFYEYFIQEIDFQDGRVAERMDARLDCHLRRMTIVKSDVWQPENEWRLTWQNDKADNNDEIYKIFIADGCIATIYLGLCLDSKVESKVVSAAEKNFPKAKIMKAVKRHGDFALEFEPRLTAPGL